MLMQDLDFKRSWAELLCSLRYEQWLAGSKKLLAERIGRGLRWRESGAKGRPGSPTLASFHASQRFSSPLRILVCGNQATLSSPLNLTNQEFYTRGLQVGQIAWHFDVGRRFFLDDNQTNLTIYSENTDHMTAAYVDNVIASRL
jgi:hypothetical protein